MTKVKLNLDYIAGFFDGEGCINLSLKGLRLIITNTDLNILMEIKEYFGELGKITKKKRYAGDSSKKECYQLIYWNRHAEKVITVLEPYLRQKRKQAFLALRFQDTYLNRKKGMKMTDAIRGKRKSLIRKARRRRRK